MTDKVDTILAKCKTLLDIEKAIRTTAGTKTEVKVDADFVAKVLSLVELSND